MTFSGVTVLMPVYNGAAFLKEAIDSILNQSYKNFELLIIDDGSTDESIAIIQSYADSRIRLVKNKKNLGITATLNKGIELARFELIARMDADDVCHSSRLQKQIDYYNLNPNTGLVCTWAREFSPHHKEIIYELNPHFYLYNLAWECWIYHPSVMFKKSAVQEVGGYQYRYCEDFDLWWRLTRKYNMAVLPEVLLEYRSTDFSLSRVTKKKEYEAAHREQIVRNVRYYTGSSLPLTELDVDFLTMDFNRIAKQQKIAVFKPYLKKLEKIDVFILQKEKERFSVDQLKNASLDKKNRIAYKLLSYYNIKEVIQLLLQLGYWSLAFKYLGLGISNKLKK